MLVFQSPGDVRQEVCSFSGNLSHDMTLRHSIQRTRDTVNGPLTLKTQLSSDPCLSPRKQLTLWIRVTGLRQVLPLTWTLEASQSDLWKRPLSRRAVGKPPIVMAAFIKTPQRCEGLLGVWSIRYQASQMLPKAAPTETLPESNGLSLIGREPLRLMPLSCR